MLMHPTLEKLQSLRLTGMTRALQEQNEMTDIDELSFEERLGLLVDREVTERENSRLKSRLKKAKLRHNVCIEDIDFRYPRGLDKALITQLTSCKWIAEHLNLLLTGPTGIGNTLHVLWLKRPVVKVIPLFMYGCPDYFRVSACLKVMDATASCWPGSPKQTFWFWTTGG
jgi:hypothetical protein